LGGDETSVHPLVEGVDRLTLPRSVHTVEEDDNGKAGLLKAELGIQEIFPEKDFPLFVLTFGDPLPKLRCFEHMLSFPAESRGFSVYYKLLFT